MGSSNSKSSLSCDSSVDPLPYLTADLPQHIVDAKMGPGSGRLFQTYRIRSREGAVFICKASVLKYSVKEGGFVRVMSAGQLASVGAAGTSAQKEEGKEEISANTSINDPSLMSVSQHPSIQNYENELRRIRKLVGNPNTHPNVLPYQSVLVGAPVARDRSGNMYQTVYLLRQHCMMTLADRLATRPFLTKIEKSFMGYQILRAVQSIHNSGVCHGYISTRNIVVTSWGWVVLTDFASFKPTRVPDDDPSEYIYHFQRQVESGDHRETPCYLAPERLSVGIQQSQERYGNPDQLTPNMDIFSVGCVLIELFLNGEKAFDLGDLLEYKEKGSVSSLTRKLNKIESSSMRAACKHMLSIDPSSRLSAEAYISLLSKSTNNSDGSERSNRGKVVFHSSFEDFLYPLMKRLVCEILSPDARIAMIANSFATAMSKLCEITDKKGDMYFQDVCGPSARAREGNISNTFLPSTKYNTDMSSLEHNSLRNLISNTEKLLKQLEAGESAPEKIVNDHDVNKLMDYLQENTRLAENGNKSSQNNYKNPPHSSPLLILTQFVLSTIRHVQHPSSKLVALNLLRHFSRYVNDEARLQRIVPVVVSLLNDTDSVVRATSIRVLSDVLIAVKVFPPSDALLFPQYIFPKMDVLVHDTEVSVRVAVAESLGQISHAARWFLEINETMKLYEAVSDQDVPVIEKHEKPTSNSDFPDHVAKLLDDEPDTPLSFNALSNDEHSTESKNINSSKLLPNSFESQISVLHETVSRWVMHLTTDTSHNSNMPKTALLYDLSRLCTFFGKEETINKVLPQILAFLNDKRDSELRALLWRRLPSVCAVVGCLATEQFIVPCVDIALVDTDEKVIGEALFCLHSLWRMSLLHRGTMLGDKAKLFYERNADKEASQAVVNEGILSKCAPLLIHPSSYTRMRTIELFCAVSEMLKYPDDTLFVLPLLRPYTRHSLSSEQLHSSLHISLSLNAPVDEKQFLEGLTRQIAYKVNARKQSRRPDVGSTDDRSTGTPPKLPDDEQIFDDILFVIGAKSSSKPQTRPNTTGKVTDIPSVGKGQSLNPDNQMDFGSDKTLSSQGGSSSAKHDETSSYDGLNLGNIQRYIDLVASHGRHQHAGNRPKRYHALYYHRIMNIETDSVSSSKAYSFIVPSQKYVELFSNPLPEWFEDLRKTVAANTSLCSPLSACRSPSTIADLYGLSMMQPTHSMQNMRKWHGENMFLGDIHPDIDGLSPEKASQILSSKDSKRLEASKNGEWYSLALLDPALLETCLLVSKLESVDIPPLPPKLGLLRETDGRAYSSHGTTGTPSTEAHLDVSKRNEWRPRIDSLIASSAPNGEHTGAVAKLVVSHDQSFFVSASHDGTCRVWEMRQLENVVDLQSSLTYSDHNSVGAQTRINDACILENSHSIVSGASDGSVHVWRVDMATSSKGKNVDRPEQSRYYDTSRVCGNSVVRKMHPNEGEILAVNHWNTNSSSLVSFATQSGNIHTWDLRCSREPFCLNIRPELGYLTSCAIGPDKNWMLAGTNHGYISLWDIRYQMMVKLWRHSSGQPVSRLATCHTVLPQDKSNGTLTERKPYFFIGCGKNESSIFDVSTGICRQCFRVIDDQFTNKAMLPESYVSMPSLEEIEFPYDKSRPIVFARNERLQTRTKPFEPNVASLIGRIGMTGKSYLVTGGSDRFLRYWDFTSPERCYTISGFLHGQPLHQYEAIDVSKTNDSLFSQKLLLCRTSPTPPTTDVSSNGLPYYFKQGLIRTENAHRDAILDVKSIEYPKKSLLSCSRDGIIKLWR